MSIKNDGQLHIAIGKSRKETSWKNKEIPWSKFVQKCETTHRTAETYTEYTTAKKPRQDEIKDIGGFVGGYLSSGRRKATAVLHRQLITLDLDFATFDFWSDFTLQYDCSALLYSTHKHSKETPRYRLIIPLSRQVFPEEYQAIARRIAGVLNIELFDPTTFQPERLMYWPSTAKDGEYVFELQDGPWLDADEILATYHDWTDSSEWPISEKIDRLVKRSMVKQGDPIEKPGIVGAFCRTYGIADAIDKYLAEIYERTRENNRFSYLKGSTAGGLVVYDDKFAYSHHGSDPTGGKLCNAFDLVRVHLYGIMDEDQSPDTPVHRTASYEAMQNLATKDPEVRRQLGEERLKNAAADFSFVPEDDTEQSSEWMAELDVDRKGKYYNTIDNIVLILENDPAFRRAIYYDEFENRPVLRRNLPWRKINHKTRYLIDRDDANIEHYIEKVYGIASGTKLEKAMQVIYERHKVHPVREYLDSQRWDGTPRLDNLLIEYMGAQDTDYVRAITRKALCAAVARIFQPGVKFDYMLTFVGKQGLGKSSLIGKLGGEWFSDSFTTIQGKEAYEQIQGVWLIEVAELAGLRKAEAEHIKHYISKREDRYRVAYGRRTENFPRQCVFFGSTNRTDFLRDPTGNRRFWPVQLSESRNRDVFSLTEQDINQIWAEAVHYYKQGEPLYLDKGMEAEAQKIQEIHSELDEREGLIHRYLDVPVPPDWEYMDTYSRRSFLNGDDELTRRDGMYIRNHISAAEIWCEALGGMQKEMTSQNTKYIHDVMRKHPEWTEMDTKMRFENYGILKGYIRKETKNSMFPHQRYTVAAVAASDNIIKN
jgi:predicted P-loop ATPase